MITTSSYSSQDKNTYAESGSQEYKKEWMEIPDTVATQGRTAKNKQESDSFLPDEECFKQREEALKAQALFPVWALKESLDRAMNPYELLMDSKQDGTETSTQMTIPQNNRTSNKKI